MKYTKEQCDFVLDELLSFAWRENPWEITEEEGNERTEELKSFCESVGQKFPEGLDGKAYAEIWNDLVRSGQWKKEL
jgi:hypothetical protein